MIQDKVVVITGGAGLIGKEFCHAVADNGGIAVIADIKKDLALDLEVEIKNKKGRAESFILDITNKNSIEELISLVSKSYGRIDAIVNNAYPRNKNYGRKLEEVEFSDFCENVNLHLGGYFLVAQQFALFFKKQGFGNIINMSSIYGVMAPRFDIYKGTPMTMPVEYAAIKSAVTHLTKYFAQYYKKDGIRCNCISPGGIFDNQNPEFIKYYSSYSGTKGMLNREDIVGALLFLLSEESKYITGQNIVIDDGFSL